MSPLFQPFAVSPARIRALDTLVTVTRAPAAGTLSSSPRCIQTWIDLQATPRGPARIANLTKHQQNLRLRGRRSRSRRGCARDEAPCLTRVARLTLIRCPMSTAALLERYR